MKIFCFLILMWSTAALAEDGLVVRFTINKSTGSNSETYTSGVLMRLTEASVLTVPEKYEVRIESRDYSGSNVNIVVTLKDLSSGKPRYAGGGATTLKVGTSDTLTLKQLPNTETSYTIFLDTSYGALPPAGS